MIDHKEHGLVGYYRVNHQYQKASYLGVVFTDAIKMIKELHPEELASPFFIPFNSKEGREESYFQSLGIQELEAKVADEIEKTTPK